MAQQIPATANEPKSSSVSPQLPIGVINSYYKLYRCSDGKYRISLFSMEQYSKAKKRPISVDDVSSTTDVSCSHRHCNPIIEPENYIKRGQQCFSDQTPQQPRTKRQRVVAIEEVATTRYRSRPERSTVAVADLIAEYIPSGLPAVKPVQEATPSSSTPLTAFSRLPIPSSPISPKWNSWIQSVGKRFPMADMSVRQVLDVLDHRPDSPENH